MSQAIGSSNWATLAREESSIALESVDGLPSIARMLSRMGVAGFEARLLHNISTPIAKLSILHGASKARQVLDELVPAVAAALPPLNGHDPAHHWPIIDILLFTNLAETHGTAVGSITNHNFGPLLPRIEPRVDRTETSEKFRTAAGFAALVLAESELARSFVAGDSVPEPPAFVAVLAGAIVNRTPFAELDPALRTHLACFPAMRAASATEWPYLFAAARAALGHCGHTPTAQIAGALHKRIMQLIGAGM